MCNVQVLRRSLLFLGLLIVVHATYDYDYVNDVDPIAVESYENIVRPMIMDDEGDDDSDDEDEVDSDSDSYEDYENENSNKRDLIKGPSYTPNIDEDLAFTEIERENDDIEPGSERKLIQRTTKKFSVPSYRDDNMEADFHRAATSGDDVPDEVDEKSDANWSSKQKETLAVPENGNRITKSKKSRKGKINVLVNVNINEKSARRSDVIRVPSTYDHAYSSNVPQVAQGGKRSGFLQQYGALQKLRQDTVKEEISGSGESETQQKSYTSSSNNKAFEARNSSLKLFTGLAFPKHNEINIINVPHENHTDTDEADDEEDAETEESGSGEVEGDGEVSAKAKDGKATKAKAKILVTNMQKSQGHMTKQSQSKFDAKKKYHPTHAIEQAAEAERGETPDTVFASKMAADREEKDNELEHNDQVAEPVSQIKENQSKKLNQELEDEVSANEKTKSTSVAKTLDPETQEMADNVKTGHLKAPKAEDVRIEEVKNKHKKSKENPKDATMSELAPEQPVMKIISNNSQNDESDMKDEAKDNIKKNNNNNDDKYETLEEVRQKFKNWENRFAKKKGVHSEETEGQSETGKENVEEKENGDKAKEGSAELDAGKELAGPEESKDTSKKSSKENSTKSDDSNVMEEPVNSWKEEEKILLEKLRNPFLDEHSRMKFKDDDDSDEDDEEMRKGKQVEKDAAEIAKSANAAFSSVVDKVTASEKEKTQEKEAKDISSMADRAFTSVVNKVTSGETFNANKDVGGISAFQSLNIANETTSSEKNLDQLQKFKEQIMNEVEKIDSLQKVYGDDNHSSKDLKEAKDVLQKDLKVVKELENNLQKNAAKKLAEEKHKQQQQLKQQQHLFSSLPKPSQGYLDVDEEVVPDAKVAAKAPKHNKKKPKQKKKKFSSYEYAYYSSKKANSKHKRKHPLAEIHSLLKAEIKRLRLRKKGKHDKQLNNIRRLVQQRLKAVIANGDLDKTAFHGLAPDIKELGKLLKARINKEKKKKWRKHKMNTKGGHMNNKDIDVMNEPMSAKKPLDSFDAQKVQQSGNGVAGLDKQLNKAQNELSQVNASSSQSGLPNTKTQNADQPTSPTDVQQATQHISNAQDVFANIQNRNVSLDVSQSNKFKTLLTTLNQKLGQIYSKAQGMQQPEQQQQYGMPNTTSYQSMPSSNDPNSMPPMYVPQTYMNGPTEIQGNAQQQPISQDAYHQTGQGKHELPPIQPSTSEDFDPDEKGHALADDEPVDTLVENLERDITEVWSYRDLFPDADSLGLDNEKVHNTYANLGSLSGLSLRRALNRALRGEDVGLAIVGGSISKGGPFSEKGLDYVLRSYFYAIEDYWNKIIRPVTGSSMIIRDVSIGGIATEYYSYCLNNHLPDDKLTNIVLWELSANDMKRYDDGLRPKPQPLEQFTRNVLSYKAKPALIFVNFFALFDWDPELSAHCRNYEDEGEDEVAKYYKITSLSWRNMVCPLLKTGDQPLFTRSKLFAEDNFHPSILGHAQMSYIAIDYIRTEFLKNLVKMRNIDISSAVARLQIPKTVYVPRPMYPQTYVWKPLCYTYMLVDNRSPNNTLSLEEENNGNFRYTVVREFKIRSDKIVGMETQQKDQFLRYRMHIPRHPNGGMEPFKRLGIMTFTDDRNAVAQFDADAPKNLDSKKKFLEGTLIKTVAENIKPGEHTLTIRSGNNGFLVCALVMG